LRCINSCNIRIVFCESCWINKVRYWHFWLPCPSISSWLVVNDRCLWFAREIKNLGTGFTFNLTWLRCLGHKLFFISSLADDLLSLNSQIPDHSLKRMFSLARHHYILAETILEESFNTSTIVDLKYLHVYNFSRLEISSVNKVVVGVVCWQHCLICFEVCFRLVIRFNVTFLSEKLQFYVWVAALHVVSYWEKPGLFLFIRDVRDWLVYIYSGQRPLLAYWQLIFLLKFYPCCLVVLDHSGTLLPFRPLVVVSREDSSLLVHLSNC
jgi:hypothetical protein